jgi:hypothetical protein
VKLYLRALIASLTLALARESSADSLSILAPDLGGAEARALRQGRVATRVLDSADGAEVVTLAAVHIKTTPEAFAMCARMPSCLFGHDELEASNHVAAASVDADLTRLQLDSRDRQQLERCSVGKCDVKLSAAAIERFRQMDWKAHDANAQATSLFRATLAELVRSYTSTGDRGLPTYEDQKRPVVVAQAISELLARPLPPLSHAPALRSYLQAYPTSALDPGYEYLCWRQERFWQQRLLTLEHVALQPLPDGGVVAAVKQIYASHYLDAALYVFAFEPDPAGGGLLVQMNRVQTDVGPEGFKWYERVVLNRLVKARLARHLGALRERLERSRAIADAPQS